MCHKGKRNEMKDSSSLPVTVHTKILQRFSEDEKSGELLENQRKSET
jgi:hypothetical protein